MVQVRSSFSHEMWKDPHKLTLVTWAALVIGREQCWAALPLVLFFQKYPQEAVFLNEPQIHIGLSG